MQVFEELFRDYEKHHQEKHQALERIRQELIIGEA